MKNTRIRPDNEPLRCNYITCIFDKLVYETEPTEKTMGAYLLQFGDDKVWIPKSEAEILGW